MAEAAQRNKERLERPMLVVFSSPRCGKCRRNGAALAQVLQRGRNHDTFDLRQVDVDAFPDLREKFRVETLPTLVVVEERRVVARLDGRADMSQIGAFLQPWLRRPTSSSRRRRGKRRPETAAPAPASVTARAAD